MQIACKRTNVYVSLPMGIGHERLDDFQRDFFLSPFSTTSHFPIRNPREFIACKNCYITVNDAGLSIGGNDFAANKRAAVVDRRFERSDEGLV